MFRRALFFSAFFVLAVAVGPLALWPIRSSRAWSGRTDQVTSTALGRERRRDRAARAQLRPRAPSPARP